MNRYVIVLLALLLGALLLGGCEGGGLIAPPDWQIGTDPSKPLADD